MNDMLMMEMRNQLIDAGRRLDARRLIAGSEGNLSARLPDGRVLITASGTMLGHLQLADFVVVDVDTGRVEKGTRTPSSEMMAHLEAYRAAPDTGAVVHAHPTSCVALTLRGWRLDGVPLPEVAYALGNVPTCEFAVPGTVEGGRAVAKWAARREALLFDRHGAITFGRDIHDALGKMEMLDAVAQAVILAGGPEALQPLTGPQLDGVLEAARRAGVKGDALKAWEEKVRSPGAVG